MEKAAIIPETGDPDVIRIENIELPPPDPGEVRLRHKAIGLNFVDTYFRSGLYPLPLPFTSGVEAAGIIEAIGPDVADLRPGDRVATFGPAPGACVTARNIAANQLLKLPDDIDFETAAAAILKGCTTEALVERCAKVQSGMTALVHAAAGGVGLILVQWLKALGVTVIGTVGSKAKADLAQQAGADHIILYDREYTASRVRELTGGAGVPIIFDGVGAATWQQSIDSISPRGLLISYGNASGPVTGVNLGTLANAGSIFITRPTLFHYYQQPAERQAGVERLWQMIRSNQIRITVGQRWPLEQLADAHRALEARQTTGATLIIP